MIISKQLMSLSITIMPNITTTAATAIHAMALYLDYLLIYLLNDWLSRSWRAVGIFTGIYVAGYALVWLCIVLIIHRKTATVNSALGRRKI